MFWTLCRVSKIDLIEEQINECDRQRWRQGSCQAKGHGACGAIQEGASCYTTDIVRRASYPMNAYFYMYGHKDINCYFNGTGRIVHDDPGYGNCVYPS
ncbi:hypothetical protein ZIOFF_046915 [Zingiber officinale]|uniref:X8 domain-containing protein n=1 Tax=Zingiber officinale TaxID=94328 RepID=A0A8J5FQ16_ZINOF|nr:hypothetical protein ZIOFF_046915 [Zingiber officinale]